MGENQALLKKIEKLEEELGSIKRIVSVLGENKKVRFKLDQVPHVIGSGSFCQTFGKDTHLYVYEGGKEHDILLKELSFDFITDVPNFIANGNYVVFSVKTSFGEKYNYRVNYKNGTYTYDKITLSSGGYINGNI